ncbi:MAG: hypothetical protein RIK85_10185 [Marinobacter sp.]
MQDAQQSLMFMGAEELTVDLPLCLQADTRKKDYKPPFLVYSLGSSIKEMKPPYEFDRYANFVCEQLLPDISNLVADNGLLVILCHEQKNSTTPPAVWRGFGQMVNYAVLLCMVSEENPGAYRLIEMPAACQSPNFATVITGPDQLERIQNTVICFVEKSPWGVSLPLLIRELGE